MSWINQLRLGREALTESQYDVAEMCLRSALAAALGESWYPTQETAEIHTALAEVLLLKGCYAEAQQLFEQSEEYFKKEGDSVDGITSAINWYGLAEIQIQQPATAEMALEFFKKAAPFLSKAVGHRKLFYQRACAFINGTTEMPKLPREKAENEPSQRRQVGELFDVDSEVPQAVITQLEEWDALLEQALSCVAKETPEDILEGYKLANKALELATRLFPLYHTASAYSMFVMATASGAMRMPGQAEDLYVTSLEIYEHLSGKYSLEAAIAKLNLAHHYRRVELFAEADAYFMGAAKILAGNSDVDQEDFQKHARIFCDMLTAWRTAQESCLLIQKGRNLELINKVEEALEIFHTVRWMLSMHFPKHHKICLVAEEAIEKAYGKLGWTEQAVKISQEIESIKLTLNATENEWKEVIAAAPPLALAKKAA